MSAPVQCSECIQGRLLSGYCKNLWYFNKNRHVLGLIHAHWKQQCFSSVTKLFVGSACVKMGGTFFSEKCSFFLLLRKENPS